MISCLDNGKNTLYKHNVGRTMGDMKGADPKLEYIHTFEWPTGDIVDLYKAGGWWKDEYDLSGIPAMMEGSFDLVIVKDRITGKAVGMGRMISDGVSDGYIQDVVVLPDLRGSGIGGRIIRELVDHGLEKGLIWIGLIAEKGSSPFYTKLGFLKFDGEPMLFHRRENDA